jgi:hypothetical protein
MGMLEGIWVVTVGLLVANFSTLGVLMIALRGLSVCCRHHRHETPPCLDEDEILPPNYRPPTDKRKPVVNDDEKAVRIERKQQDKKSSLY